MTLKTIEQEWDGYAAMIFDGMKPSDVHIKETKQAFFAGYFALLAVQRNVLGDPAVTEDSAVEFLGERWDEAQEFYRGIMRRYSEQN